MSEIELIGLLDEGIPDFIIIEGATYRYIKDWPAGCKGGLYQVLCADVMDVPSYQHKVLVRCVEGKDQGLWFTCTPKNFSQRYELVHDPRPRSVPEPKTKTLQELADNPPEPSLPGKTLDMTSKYLGY